MQPKPISPTDEVVAMLSSFKLSPGVMQAAVNTLCQVGNTLSPSLPFLATCPAAFPFGLVVRIPGFHPGGPGSIPGMGTFSFSSFGFLFFLQLYTYTIYTASTLFCVFVLRLEERGNIFVQ